jgi:GntR family transcriptional repressor for pyruvate dehydrogenase complex
LLQRQTLTSQVIGHLLKLIKTGQIKPGSRLPTEKQLSQELGVSRTCIREAMKSLESLGLISVRPRIGAIVLDPSSGALFNVERFSTAAHLQRTDVLIEFRKILEVGLASLAAEKAKEEDFIAMKKAIDDHKRALETDRIAYHADLAFHMAVATASKNPIVIMTLLTISEPLEQQRIKTNSVPHAAEDGLRDHMRIFRAIKERNPRKARAAMREHMETAERYWRIAQSDVSQPASLAGASDSLQLRA